MNVTATLRGLIAAAVMLSACSGKDDPNATATSTSKGDTGTTGDTQGATTTGSTDATTAGTKTTSMSASATDPTETTDPSDTACFFLMCDSDQGAMEEWCDIWSQDCPEGEKCMPWADDGDSWWNSTKCSPIDPDPKQPGEACTVEGNGVSGVDDCAKASMCWDVDPENEGVCIAFCEGTSAEDATCDPGFRCVIVSGPPLILCLPDCDPLAQDCPGDDLCIPSGENWICVLDASGEAGVYGDPCEFDNACDPGLYCLAPEYVEDCKGAGCCSPFCDTSKANTCPGDTQECIPWYEEGMAPPGEDNIGICGIPQ